MKKYVWTYGLAGGLIVSTLMYLSFFFIISDDPGSMKYGEIAGYISMLLALSTVFFGVKTYREEALGGHITFKKAFLTGLTMVLIASALYVFSWMIYAYFVDPDFMDQYFESSIEALRKSGEPLEEIERQINNMQQYKESYKNPFIQIGVTFLEIFPVGLLVSLFSAAVLKKKN